MSEKQIDEGHEISKISAIENFEESQESIVDINKIHPVEEKQIPSSTHTEVIQPNQQAINPQPNETSKCFNPDYFDEFGRPKYEDVIQFENQLRAEIEQSSPLISDKLQIDYLINEFKESNFINSVLEITQKYKYIRTVRRDGNCFYRAFMFRLFEELSQKKNSKLHNDVVKVVEESKSLCEKNGYQWMVFEDFYNMFISEWKFVFQLDPLNSAEYM